MLNSLDPVLSYQFKTGVPTQVNVSYQSLDKVVEYCELARMDIIIFYCGRADISRLMKSNYVLGSAVMQSSKGWNDVNSK